jgi:hypothetical protein
MELCRLEVSWAPLGSRVNYRTWLVRRASDPDALTLSWFLLQLNKHNTSFTWLFERGSDDGKVTGQTSIIKHDVYKYSMSPETLPVCRLGYLFREGMVLRMRNFFHIKSSIKEQYSHLLFFANHHFCIPSHRKCPPIKDIKKLNTMSIVQNLYFADWRGSPPQPKPPPPPPHPLPLCLNKQWVEVRISPLDTYPIYLTDSCHPELQ